MFHHSISSQDRTSRTHPRRMLLAISRNRPCLLIYLPINRLITLAINSNRWVRSEANGTAIKIEVPVHTEEEVEEIRAAHSKVIVEEITTEIPRTKGALEIM